VVLVLRGAAVVGALLLAACSSGGGSARPSSSPTPPASPAPTTAPTASATPAPRPAAFLVGAGDIGVCGSRHDEATARLLDTLPGTVATFGDNAYPDGSRADFDRCYSWGRFRDRIRPAIGNHEYETAGAVGYFGFFGTRAGPRGKGYYSYELGSWHVVVLNSMCSVVPCRRGSEQERWLRADLAAHPARCTLAYWHHPRYTSGAQHQPDVSVRPLFDALYDAGAEVVLAGHNHQYERFAPMDADGHLDRARGIRSFVVGTGGAFLHDFGPTQPNSEVRARAWGLLRLTLRADDYDWRFVPTPGSELTDSGSARCH